MLHGTGEANGASAGPRDPYTRALPAAIPRIDPEWDRRRREGAGPGNASTTPSYEELR
ncbi:hypothetical protein ABZ547_10680 [Streptomyces sparsogenes]|uniref:hypothetical protein n=1 Tax=Streptomyces sparsogenes TaxID=67365 RepID=UPI0034117F9A